MFLAFDDQNQLRPFLLDSGLREGPPARIRHTGCLRPAGSHNSNFSDGACSGLMLQMDVWSRWLNACVGTHSKLLSKRRLHVIV
jgi:hypothetical protein